MQFVFERFGTSTCQAPYARDCTQAVVELVAITTLFERSRVHVSWQTLPRLYGRPGFFHLHFAIGYQFL